MPPHNAPSWKKLVRRLAPDAEPGPSTTKGQVEALEGSLGVALTPSLREFLTEIGGLEDEYGFAIVWPAEEIDRQNREYRSNADFRELYMPFDNLLFFGAEGNGDLFALAIRADGRIHEDDVFRWDHETDGRAWFASRLEEFLERRMAEEE